MIIAVVAPSSPLEPAAAERARQTAQRFLAGRNVEIVFHPQCFLKSGHFAGPDQEREAAFVEVANDPRYGAVWFARGGYGACRFSEAALARLGPEAANKTYLGYSDAGNLLAGLYRRSIGRVAHGPMVSDINRLGGEAPIERALAWLVDGDARALEPHCASGVKVAAFNLTILSELLGTPLEPDLTDHVLMIEDVGEYMYRIDRALFHLSSTPSLRKIRGLLLGRFSDIPPNDPDFGQSEEEAARYWCAKSGIAYLGRADIGHDIENKIVPFGAA